MDLYKINKQRRDVPVKQIIDSIAEEFKRYLEEFASEGEISLSNAEQNFIEKYNNLMLRFLSELYEEKDHEILDDHEYRKEKGLTVQRRHDSRNVTTVFGNLDYERTYYKKAVGYEYPTDMIVGIEPRSRISLGTSAALVELSCKMSYAESSRMVTDGSVSKQSVMRTIRRCEPSEDAEIKELRKVPVLHIDADEDHVNIQGKGSSYVPEISIYEGIERHGKRRKCINCRSISEYGKPSSDLWSEVLDELESNYDLTNTKIYLHGDGARWIKEGLEWLPNSTYVLDQYHKNKYLKMMLSGLTADDAKEWKGAVLAAFETGDRKLLEDIGKDLVTGNPEQTETISRGTGYLADNLGGITICYRDPESKNGGATEPHVQHVLSHRLSTTPHAWSEETLKHFVPILATGNFSFEKSAEKKCQKCLTCKKVESPARTKVKYSNGMADPKGVIYLPAMCYKQTQLRNALSHYLRRN